jgi:hypothetical protein
LCHNPALVFFQYLWLRINQLQKRLDQSVEAFYHNESLNVFFFLFFSVLIVLPHGEFTGSGESGLNSETRQNPAVKNEPDGKNAAESQ